MGLPVYVFSQCSMRTPHLHPARAAAPCSATQEAVFAGSFSRCQRGGTGRLARSSLTLAPVRFLFVFSLISLSHPDCSEQMNVQSLGSIFKGLCQTGAWGCFDEFNRIPIEVLSVVSTQVSCIMNAIREKRNEFDFMGEIVKLIPAVGIFITMNPGYAGRTGQIRGSTRCACVQLRRFRCALCAVHTCAVACEHMYAHL